MTNNKPLGEWTLNEVKAECDGRDGCLGCPFSKTFRSDELENGCGIQEPPFSWDLTDLETDYCPNCGAKMDGGEDDA